MKPNENLLEKIGKQFKGKDILSLEQFDSISVFFLFKVVNKIKRKIKKRGYLESLKGSIFMLLFFEPSSRTFGSFSSAIKRLGGQTISYQNPLQTSSAVKGESLEDTTRTFEHYSDCIIIRHPEIGSALRVAKTAKIPVINAGDGGGEHPTQTLYDLYTIYERFGRLDNLTAIVSGDPLHSRAIRSFVSGLSFFKNNRLYVLSPESLQFPKNMIKTFQKKGLHIFEINNFKDIPKNSNIWYWNRIQKERFKNPVEYKKNIGKYVLTKKILDKIGNKNMIIMDPLPRVEEIKTEVDSDPRSLYLGKQMENGLYVRMALVSLILGRL